MSATTAICPVCKNTIHGLWRMDTEEEHEGLFCPYLEELRSAKALVDSFLYYPTGEGPGDLSTCIRDLQADNAEMREELRTRRAEMTLAGNIILQEDNETLVQAIYRVQSQRVYMRPLSKRQMNTQHSTKESEA